MSRHAWIDASAGVAGDMLLGALLDAGASLYGDAGRAANLDGDTVLGAVRSAVRAVAGDAVRLRVHHVTRAGLRALKVDVQLLDEDPPTRRWREVRELLGRVDLPAATAVFTRLAEAEARVHGIEPDDVHFHEVGALDAIADVVGCCAALDRLGITKVSGSPVALGSGTVRARHGRLPVPAPAVVELARGWQVASGGAGELATPTGMALLRTFAQACEQLPPMTLEAVGIGAGTRDPAERANVIRVLVGNPAAPRDARPAGDATDETLLLLEANVDDLDPRLWPGVLAGLMELGAADAWLTPILMKKGRPAHTLSVLCRAELVPAVRARIFRDTSTLGIRHAERGRVALDRAVVEVRLDGVPTGGAAAGGAIIRVKVGYLDGVAVQAMPEFEDVAAAAREQGRSERMVLQEALAAAAQILNTARG
ncbi:nickel pincer cofactor biosynthesis protein LarC [Actinoplanes sp. CA-030573]|uniref:nickel pincer cofactor biosynthesis protein LarC n=1 Tax=Actinoplanes sp. CA-030573 TaxID=3239898 RepID=UPI003D8BB1E5